MTQSEKTIQLSPAMCRVLFEALQPIVEGEQSSAQLTLTDDNDGSAIDLVLVGEHNDE